MFTGGSGASRREGSNDEASFTEVQARSYAKIRTLLLSAGFLRIRDDTMSPFQKLVSALGWLISNCGEGVEVDVFDRQRKALGAKIAVGEVIVERLRAMKCPVPLSAPQIQGYDMPVLFSVTQWLVKQMIQFRKSKRAFHSNLAELNFSQGFDVPPEHTEDSTTFVDGALNRYRPTRRFRRNPAMWQATLTREATVLSCLLEYGEKITDKSHFVEEMSNADTKSSKRGRRSGPGAGAGGGGDDADIERKLAEIQKQAALAEEEKVREAVALQKTMMGNMAKTKDASGADVSGSSVGAAVSMQGDAMRDAAAAYSKKAEAIQKAAESGDFLASTKLGKAQAHKRRVAVLSKSAARTESKTKTVMSSVEGVATALQNLETALQRATAYNQRVVSETEKLSQMAAASQHQDSLARLNDLVTLNESLVSQESEFRSNCQRQLAELDETLARVRKSSHAQEDARLSEIEEMYEDVSAKYAKFRLFLSQKNQDVARLSRAIDDVPTRSELIQYERRFVELYDQVHRKLDETRKYYVTYNMLVQCHEFLTKEEKLISSISSQFASSMRSRSSKEAFVSKCAQIVTGLQGTLAQQRQNLGEKEAIRDGKRAAYQALIEEQRMYFKAVKEFQEACDKNEMLVQALTAARGE